MVSILCKDVHSSQIFIIVNNRLYENIFFGLSNGIIIESGAVDGVLFSTSLLFERFANWTSIHIGNILIE